MTALLQAARRHDIPELRRLIAQGVDVRAVRKWGRNVLIYLAQKPPADGPTGWEELLDVLDEEARYCSGPEELVVMQGLIELGADIECKDTVGDTALCYAVLADNVPTVALLLGAGAEYLAFSDYDMSALVYALRDERMEIVGQMLAQARTDGRLAEIATEPRYQKYIDAASESMLDLLETAIGGVRAARAQRQNIACLKSGLEWFPEPDEPIRLYLSTRQLKRAELRSGPILKVCLNCLYPYQAFFGYHGSRYGQVGGYGCPRCHAYFALIDDDMLNSRVHHYFFDGQYVKGRDQMIDGPWEKAGFAELTIDYAQLYRLDTLGKIESQYGSHLFDALRGRQDDCTLTEIAEILRREIPSARVIEHFDNRLGGRQALPKEVDAWIDLVKTILPEESDRKAERNAVCIKRADATKPGRREDQVS